MQLEATIYQDRTVLPAEWSYLPWEVWLFVTELESIFKLCVCDFGVRYDLKLLTWRVDCTIVY
jgi:hypothetical protein